MNVAVGRSVDRTCEPLCTRTRLVRGLFCNGASSICCTLHCKAGSSNTPESSFKSSLQPNLFRRSYWQCVCCCEVMFRGISCYGSMLFLFPGINGVVVGVIVVVATPPPPPPQLNTGDIYIDRKTRLTKKTC